MQKELKEKIKKISEKPGIYQFRDIQDNLLYIGKAKSLKKRVGSYFSKKHEDLKTNKLVKKVKDIEVITTKNEVEALILEASLIRKYKPPYNIDLKESSGRYACLKITDEKFPRVVVARNEKDKQDGKIFGPFTSAISRREAQYYVNSILKLRTCNKLPKIACLLYHIHLCSAPCIKKISVEKYQDNVKKAEKFLKGDINELKKELEIEMRGLSDDLKYEQAKVVRDQILAISRLQEKQNINLPKRYDQDVINYINTPKEMVLQLFNINKGLISAKHEFRAGSNNISEFLRRYYDDHDIPEEIIIPEKLSDAGVLEKYLSMLKKRRVVITVPKQGNKLALLNLLKQNLEISARVGNAVLSELQTALNLPKMPNIIEMFDISHTGGEEIVASMVQFSSGQPNKSAYRKFKMRTVKDNDDFKSMREVVGRRYSRLLEEKKQLPDLIIVDGGRGQLSSALAVLRELGLNIPLISLAKREEEVYTVGRRFPVRLSKKSEGLKLLQRIRDEAHRFAITFHRQRRSKKLLLK